MKPANWLVPFSKDDVKSVMAGTAPIRTVLAVITSQTCGENCWHAKEEVCRCSCGGANHGCLLVNGAQQPIRTKRIDGAMYELAEVGVKPYEIDERLRKDFPPKCVVPESIPQYCDKDKPGFKTYYWTYQSLNSPLRCKTATKEQLAKWPELTAYRNIEPWKLPVYVLWKLKAN